MTLTLVDPVTRRSLRPCPIVLLRTAEVAHSDRLVANGDLVRLRPGVLAPGHGWRELRPWDRYLARVHAVLRIHPEAVLCLESAAALLGLPVFGDPMVVHVLDDAHGTSRVVNGVRTHTSSNDRAIIEMDGIRVVGAVDTAVDHARHRHPAVALAVADAALRQDPRVGVESLVVTNESRRSSRGRRVARWVAHRATPLAETALESVSRAAVEWLGFDEPELQHVVSIDGYTDRVDMWWARQSAAGEADGDIKYDGSLNPGAEAIRAEKARDRRLLRHVSGVAHWGWADVVDVQPLRQELLQIGLRIRHPEDSRYLAGLRAVTRPHRSF